MPVTPEHAAILVKIKGVKKELKGALKEGKKDIVNEKYAAKKALYSELKTLIKAK